jgi:hypothetical protein
LTNKEINFKDRNDMVNMGKNEDLSETEVDLNDEIIEEEKEKNIFNQTVNPTLLIKDNSEKKEGELENEEGNEVFDGENNKEKEKEIEFNQNENLKNENNLNNINSVVKNIVDTDGKNIEIINDEENN